MKVEVGGEQLVAISVPIGRNVTIPGLTKAEDAVVSLVLRGLSNQSIARRRGTSSRTVANQLQSIYRKLGVASRSEIAGRVAGWNEDS